MANTEIDDILTKFNTLTGKPTKYLTVQKDIKEDIKKFVKSLYDYTKAEENCYAKSKKNSLPQLIIEDFDDEQIWQQIELQNNEHWDQWVWEVANSVSTKNNLKFPVEIPTDTVKEQMDNNSSIENEQNFMSEDDSNASEAENNQIEDETVETKRLKAKSKPSVVDDKFFKLEEMEKFLLKEEKKESHKMADDSDEESVDMFDEIDDEESGDEGGKDMMYSDFFNDQDHDYEMESKDNLEPSTKVFDKSHQKYKTTEKKVTFAEQMSVDDEESSSENEDSDTITNKESYKSASNEEKKSEFELRQLRLQQQMGRLEEKTLKEAPWQLKGEVDALKRPHNSLLEEVVDFDLTSRPPPIITEQTTVTLEELIKRRVKDKAWDDVIKKQKPVDDQLAFRKPEVIDQSKSKLSLAQVYEAEYLKQKQKQTGENEEEKEPESHKEIREAMTSLFSKLDALCHYHYTPKPPQAEVKIVTNTPAISMEEVAPVATSDANLLAPEEIKKKRRGDLISKEERTQTDKNRERRKKKKLQRKKGKVLKVTEQRNTKKGTEASDQSLKTSKAFFQQLNDDSKGLIKSKKSKLVKNK